MCVYCTQYLIFDRHFEPNCKYEKFHYSSLILTMSVTMRWIHKHTCTNRDRNGESEKESKCEGDDVNSKPESRELYDIDRLFVCWVRTHYVMATFVGFLSFMSVCRLRFHFQCCCWSPIEIFIIFCSFAAQ